MTGQPAKPVRFGDLGVRVLSGVALAALASLDLLFGGIWVTVLAAVATALMLWELHRMVTGEGGLDPPAPALIVAGLAGVAAVAATSVAGIAWGGALLGLGVLCLAGCAGDRTRFLWLAGGLVYIGIAMAYATVIRDTPRLGLAAVVWLILVVVAADVGAYFAGRSIGGPKLWPAVSPNKTWSGALGGLALAFLVAMLFATVIGWPVLPVAIIAIGVALASQAGDLLESTVKRHFGVKDASRLIPGHGGVMDRLDGLMGGLWFFALYDLLGGRLGG